MADYGSYVAVGPHLCCRVGFLPGDEKEWNDTGLKQDQKPIFFLFVIPFTIHDTKGILAVTNCYDLEKLSLTATSA